MIINHRKPSPSLNQGIFRPSPSPSPFNSHILILVVLIIYFVLLVLVLPRQQVSLPTKYNLPQLYPRYDFQLKYTIYPLFDSPSSFASTSTSDNIEKYHFFSYSTPTHRFQPSLSSYELTLIQSLPLFLNLNAIHPVRLQFFRYLWHLS